MNLKLICIGKVKEAFFKDAIEEYSKRLSKYCVLNILELPEEKISIENDAYCEISKQKESIRILSKIDNKDYVILFDINGESMDSINFARKIQCLKDEGRNIAFVIGGSYGVDENVKARANYKLSFSKMTFPHQLFRIIALEQIYRAFKINSNEKYHK